VEIQRNYRQRQREKDIVAFRATQAAYKRAEHARMKQQAIAAYGPCACCGISEPKFLALDHVNGRTDEDDLNGTAMLRLAKKKGWPPEYRMLCHNCNIGHLNGGVCPHQAEAVAA
jgi:hypothetical protein